MLLLPSKQVTVSLMPSCTLSLPLSPFLCPFLFLCKHTQGLTGGQSWLEVVCGKMYVARHCRRVAGFCSHTCLGKGGSWAVQELTVHLGTQMA